LKFSERLNGKGGNVFGVSPAEPAVVAARIMLVAIINYIAMPGT